MELTFNPIIKTQGLNYNSYSIIHFRYIRTLNQYLNLVPSLASSN